VGKKQKDFMPNLPQDCRKRIAVSEKSVARKMNKTKIEYADLKSLGNNKTFFESFFEFMADTEGLTQDEIRAELLALEIDVDKLEKRISKIMKKRKISICNEGDHKHEPH
jgi:hypothetical protein